MELIDDYDGDDDAHYDNGDDGVHNYDDDDRQVILMDATVATGAAVTMAIRVLLAMIYYDV